MISERWIVVSAVEAAPHATYIRALCRMRGEERTFRADRILMARRKDGNTLQEIAEPEPHFLSLVPDEKRPDADHDAVMSRARAGLDALIWIAMADGEISIDEKEILLDYIGERNGMAGKRFADVPWSRAKATAYIDSAKPTFTLAAGGMARMTRSGRGYAMARRYGVRMAECGGDGGTHRFAQIFKV